MVFLLLECLNHRDGANFQAPERFVFHSSKVHWGVHLAVDGYRPPSTTGPTTPISSHVSSEPGSRMEKKFIMPMKNFWGSKFICFRRYRSVVLPLVFAVIYIRGLSPII